MSTRIFMPKEQHFVIRWPAFRSNQQPQKPSPVHSLLKWNKSEWLNWVFQSNEVWMGHEVNNEATPVETSQAECECYECGNFIPHSGNKNPICWRQRVQKTDNERFVHTELRWMCARKQKWHLLLHRGRGSPSGIVLRANAATWHSRQKKWLFSKTIKAVSLGTIGLSLLPQKQKLARGDCGHFRRMTTVSITRRRHLVRLQSQSASSTNKRRGSCMTNDCFWSFHIRGYCQLQVILQRKDFWNVAPFLASLSRTFISATQDSFSSGFFRSQWISRKSA